MTSPKNARRNAEIIRLRKAGWQPCDIARLMKLTRQTVSGVVFRAGLSDPENNPATPGRPLPEHIRQAVSMGHRRLWADPEQRAARLEMIHQVKPWTKRHRGQEAA